MPYYHLQKSVNKSRRQSEPVLSPAVNSDSSLEVSLKDEYDDDKGWLDYNPEAKMHLSNLDKEECISDDETEVLPSSV